MRTPRCSLFLLWFCSTALAGAAPVAGLQTMELTVDGAARTALVYVPPAITPGRNLPVVFVFHGHGGNSRNAVNTFGIDHLWPEAISVYPQGLNTPGTLTDPAGTLPGWQKSVGDQGDRDLHFFDALLDKLKRDYPVDAKRIYCTGHSNGGGFTYLLWLARPQVLAAVAPSAAAARYAGQLTPKPAMILAGCSDRLVKFEWQERTIDTVRRVNGCQASGEAWEGQASTTLYPSTAGTPLVTFIHEGGHMMDPAAPALIVKFFHNMVVQPRSQARLPPYRDPPETLIYTTKDLDGTDAFFQPSAGNVRAPEAVLLSLQTVRRLFS